MSLLSDKEALAILNAIDCGDDPIVEHDNWEDEYAGDVKFKTRAGHTVVVFNDCNSWDYVDSVHHADGRVWGGDDSNLGWLDSRSANWTPRNVDAWPSLDRATRAWLVEVAKDSGGEGEP